MIRVDLSQLVFIYLFLFLNTVFIAWLGYEWRRQRREKLALRNRLRCSMCGFTFEDTSATPLPRCPRCGSLNERFRFRDL
jgi:hypothetical protein